MQNKPSIKIDFQSCDAIKQILPRAPIISSHSIGWQAIFLEYHRQPEHDTPEYNFPHNTISIGLGYQAKEFKVNKQIYKNFVSGNIGIIPAYYDIKTQAYGNAEFILLTVESDKLASTIHESVDVDKLEIKPQVYGFDPLIYQIGLELKKELETTGVDSRLYAESMATALAVHLIKRYSTQTQNIKQYTDGLPNYKLREVIAYINEHLDENLSLAELAVIAQMSPHYFASLFKQSIGFAPHQYITKCRVEKAKQLLQNQELTILEVCQQVGFQSPSHFARVFRKYTTTTPKLYRGAL
ncbi:AraC family transcriptional regulator [Calothrix sp. HK-06]|nr:AraC family transcriptional regulator [Calothrix sp. HK-06]